MKIFDMTFFEKAMVFLIVLLIIACLVFGPRLIGVGLAILLAAALSMRGDRHTNLM